MLDIDFFKKYNDTYGHLQGDICLKEVATTLAKSVHCSSDVVARYGGEEFAIILPDINERDAYKIAEKIRRNIEQLQIAHRNSDISNFVTISIGVASLKPDLETEAEELINVADQMLYKAKASGRNRVEVYQEMKILE